MSAPQPALKAADRILATAGELFYREGARAVGVDEIVAKAGATKPSLYRAFGSKDLLIAAYLETLAEEMWRGFDTAVEAHPEDPRAQVLAYFDSLSDRLARKEDRGCGLSNALVEYPARQHPGRVTAVGHKETLRKRLRELTRAMGVRKPKKLADALLLLIEGAHLTRQVFGPDGPAGAARGAAEALIEAHARQGAD